MAACSACNFENIAGMKFCGACGTRLSNACPSCAFDNPPQFRFCGNCGSSLAAPKAEVPKNDRRDAERRQLTVLFCDLVNSTALAESVDAEEYREIVRQYQVACASVIRRVDGHVAQYLGDGILAYFGYPRAHEDDARRAGHAALGMIEAVQALATPAHGGAALAVRIGVHTGPVVAGNISSKESHQRLAVGSTPNIAARLQGIATPNSVMLSGDTERLLHGWFDVDALGVQELKGVSRPVTVFRLIREARRNGRFEMDDAKRLSPLVGREEEDALLAARLTATREGDGQIVLLSGEAGVGKSRLIQSMRARAIDEGFTCLVGRCAAVHQSSPLLPIIDLMESLLGFDADSSDAVRLDHIERHLDGLEMSRAEHVPLIASLLGVPLGETYAPLGLLPQKQRARTFESLLMMLLRGAEQRPIAFVMEDLHWADASTMEFLTQFISQPPVPHLMSVFTVRTEFALPWSARSPVTQLTLPKLSDRDVRTMIENLSGELRLPAGVIEQVVQKTDGIPVFVEELTRMVLELGLVSDGAPVTSAVMPPLLDIPETLQDSLLARLDLLGEAKEVAQIGAVLGRVFPYDLLLATAQFEEVVLQRHLARLVDAELLYQRGSLPNATFTFKHALIQDAAYALLLRSSRRTLHERVARVLLQDFPARAAQQPELVAHHFTEAAQIVEAIQQWQQAGMQSLQRSASVEAVAQLRRGLALVGELPESPLRSSFELGLLTTLGAAYASTMGYAAPETAQTYARATELSDELGDVPELFWAIRGVWSAVLVRGDLVRALEVGERLLRSAEVSGSVALRMEAHYTVGATHMFMGNMVPAREQFASVVNLDHADRDTSGRMYTAVDVVAVSMALGAQTAWLLGLDDEANRLTKDSLALVDALAHPVSQAFVQNQASTIGYLNGDRDVARHHAAETIRLSETYGIFFAPIGALMMAWVTDDSATASMMIGMLRGGGSHVGSTVFYCMLAEAQWRNGDVKGAEGSIDEGLAIAANNHEGYWEPELYKLRGDIAAKGERTGDAERAYRSAVECATMRGLVALKRRAQGQLDSLASRA